ncbi:MAG TPA: sugar-binding protein [Pirellulales bacterium]|jgi:hypothetical protein|nr:sugar-binding protein [Pirellulales bacterium]
MSNRVWVPALYLLIAFAALMLAPQAVAQQTDNAELRAVPAPAQVAIDGKLDDWDLSGEILICYDLARLADVYSVRAAALYDATNLYLSFRFKDKTPLVNFVDPKSEPNAGWKSDSVELRIKTDRVAQLQCWYYTERKEPAMTIHYGMFDRRDPDYGDLNEPLAQGAQEAFLIDKDGQGYVQEMAIPWKLLTREGQVLKAGDAMLLAVGVNWGDAAAKRSQADYIPPEHRYVDLINPDNPQRDFIWQSTKAWGTVKFLPQGKLAPSPSLVQLSVVEQEIQREYSTEGPVPLRYEMPYDGAATLAIEKPDGTRVKNLIADYPRKAGSQVDYWDGTDDDGHPVAPGTYRVRGLCHQPLDLLYEFAYGNPGNPPYANAAGTGNWLANHDNPMAVAADEKQIYIAAPQSEGATTVLATDYQGQRRWGHGNISGGMMVRQGEYLYMVVGGAVYAPFIPEGEVHITRLDPASGKYMPFADGKYSHKIAEIPADWSHWPSYKPLRPEVELVATHGYDAACCMRQTLGLAAAGGRLYASLFHQGQIVVVDPEKGEAVGQIALEHPAGLAADASGAVYALSNQRLMKIAPDGGQPVLVAEGLSAPVGLATDRQGNLYVSDWGNAMCVKVFSPHGRLLRTIGLVGGRSLAGTYDPSGMFRPWGLAIDSEDRLWVAEYDTSPRRVSVWNAATGAFLREFCGTTYYGAVGAYVNKLNPRQAFVMGNTCELDWDKGLWRVTGTLFRATRPEDLFGGMDREGLKLEVVRYQGRDLLLATDRWLNCVAELGPSGAKPLAAMGSTAAFWNLRHAWPDMVMKQFTSDPKKFEDLQKRMPGMFNGRGPAYPFLGFLMQTPWVKSQFVWADENGDGGVQQSEIHFYSREELGSLSLTGSWRSGFGPDLSVYTANFHRDGPSSNLELWKLPVARWTGAGVPVYDVKSAERIAAVPTRGGPGPSTWTDSDGNTLTIEGGPLRMFSSEGKLLWTYPSLWTGVAGSHSAPRCKRGRTIGENYVLGSAQLDTSIGEVLAINANLGERYLLTTDGLYLASLFQDGRGAPDSLPEMPRRGMSIDGCSAGGESFGGEFFRSPLDGKVYLGGSVASCREASVIAQVTGLESTRRLPTETFNFTPEQHAEAAKVLALRAEREAAAKNLAIARLQHAQSGVPKQEAFDWKNDRRVARWSFDPRHAAEATWTYDNENLYLCVRGVTDDSPMVNEGKDVRTLFKTGDAIEFELRTEPDRDDKEVIPGDLRLLVSVLEKKPVAVLYRYSVPGTTQPVTFTSPVGTTPIDQVEVLGDAQIAVDRSPTGYSVRVAVPLKDLQFSPAAGKSYRGDVGVVYSDKTGNVDELRMYWANSVTGLVNDLFMEAKIVPAAWGRFTIEE